MASCFGSHVSEVVSWRRRARLEARTQGGLCRDVEPSVQRLDLSEHDGKETATDQMAAHVRLPASQSRTSHNNEGERQSREARLTFQQETFCGREAVSASKRSDSRPFSGRVLALVTAWAPRWYELRNQ